MSIAQDTQNLYCSTAEVARYLRGNKHLVNGDFPTESNAPDGFPSQTDVEQFIEKWSSKMDRKTGQSWRVNRVRNETHDHETLYYWLSGHPVRLMKRNIITPLDATKGDKIEVWTGNKWENWVEDYNEGRDEDYWVDAPIGVLFIYERAILRPHPKFRISYRYGRDNVPADIRDAVAAASAADLYQSDVYGVTVPGQNNAGNSDPFKAANEWYEQFEDTVKDYKKLHFI